MDVRNNPDSLSYYSHELNLFLAEHLTTTDTAKFYHYLQLDKSYEAIYQEVDFYKNYSTDVNAINGTLSNGGKLHVYYLKPNEANAIKLLEAGEENEQRKKELIQACNICGFSYDSLHVVESEQGF